MVIPRKRRWNSNTRRGLNSNAGRELASSGSPLVGSRLRSPSRNRYRLLSPQKIQKTLPILPQFLENDPVGASVISHQLDQNAHGPLVLGHNLFLYVVIQNCGIIQLIAAVSGVICCCREVEVRLLWSRERKTFLRRVQIRRYVLCCSSSARLQRPREKSAGRCNCSRGQ